MKAHSQPFPPPGAGSPPSVGGDSPEPAPPVPGAHAARRLTENPAQTRSLPADEWPTAPPLAPAAPPAPPKFLERVRHALRQRAVLPLREETYVAWMERYIRCNRLQHPRELGPAHVSQFLQRLAAEPKRQAEAREALRFLYEEFLPTDPVPPPPASQRELPKLSPPPLAQPPPTRSPFLNRCHEVLRVRHDSLRTEECYVNWIKRFILFHGKRHPETMGAAEIEAFLTHLAVEGHVAASTQNQAFHALLFLYQQVLGRKMGRG